MVKKSRIIPDSFMRQVCLVYYLTKRITCSFIAVNNNIVKYLQLTFVQDKLVYITLLRCPQWDWAESLLIVYMVDEISSPFVE